jgi:ligand-binding sensor domain-containing protein
MQRSAIILACFFVCANCFAQKYPFVHYTPREGLVNNKARSIFQDSKGKLYVCTYGGLSIYDGTRFINYTTTNGLAVDLVNDIVEMGEDSLWIILNDNRIQCLVKGRIKNFVSTDGFVPLINQLIKCSDGYYYALADEGLFKLKDKKFIRLPFTGLPGADSANTLLQAVEVDKKLYILSNPQYKLVGSNLVVYDLVKNKVLAFQRDMHGSHLNNTLPGQVWITCPGGLMSVNKVTEFNQPIVLRPLADSFHFPKPIFPQSILKDRQGNFWFALANGVYKIDQRGETTLFTIENGLSTNSQNYIFQDRENNMWFTNEQTGLCKLSNSQLAFYPIFRGYTPSDIFIPTGSDSVLVQDLTHHKIMLLLPNGKEEEWINPDERFPYIGRFIAGKNLWMLSDGAIYELKKSQTLNHYSVRNIFKDASRPISTNTAIVNHDGNIISVSEKLVLISDGRMLQQSIEYIADQVTVDKNNLIWVAPRNNKLFCFRLTGSGNNKTLTLLKKFDDIIPSNSPRSITADQSGNLWIGTRDGGLYCLHFDGLNITSRQNLKTVNGLSENFINYLYCDKDNNIWACTPSGLDKIKMENGHFLVENITSSSNLYFPIFKVQQQANGLVWIMTGAGIIIYNPSRPVNDWKPSLAFSDIVNGGGEHISIPPDGELSYKQNNLTFQLSAPTFIDEKQTRFSYLLEGSGNKTWSTPSADASINFVNLPSGEYVLRAKAIFLHGLYPNIESSYSFTILPPWWQTWWFRLVAVLFIVGLMIIAVRFYYNRKLEKQKVALEKQRAIEKERTRIATDMHDDLGAGLSQIKFLSETIGMRKQKHLPIEEEIDSIRTFSHEMIDKMGEIVWALNEKNDTLDDLLSYTRSYAVEYLQQNGISCRVKEPDNLPQDYVSSEFRRNIYLTVKETLHNVVKHAQATEVMINIDITDFLSIQIRDNGKGIDETPERPPGNGLINMNTRIKGLGGRFEIINNNGTQVSIFVPLNT